MQVNKQKDVMQVHDNNSPKYTKVFIMLPSWLLSLTPFLVVSFLCVHMVQTWFVPDEYWQSLEVSHKLAFGYGYLTWEWKEGIRSYIYPLTLSLPNLILKRLSWDSSWLLPLLPRYMQSLLSGLAHYYLSKIVARTCGRETGKWLAFHLLTSWFLFYIGSRTLLNTLETSLAELVIALWLKSSHTGRSDSLLAILILISVYLRPTSAAFYVPIIIYEIIMACKKDFTSYFIKMTIPCATVFASLVACDSFMYGRLCIPLWNFFKFNFFSNMSEIYGTHPWHWYLSSALPSICGILLLPYGFLLFRRESNRVPLIPSRQTGLILSCAVCYIFCHSMVRHKEIRFMAPVIPALCLLLAHWSRKLSRKKSRILIAFTLICNVPLIMYFGLRHQRGTLSVVNFLAEEAKSLNASILFLAPCHSTPFYSHIHAEIPMRFLKCEPNLRNVENYAEEADQFFFDPELWLANEFGKEDVHFTHVVLFDSLYPKIAGFLRSHNYSLLQSFFHTDLPEGKVGRSVLLYKKDLRSFVT